MAGLGEDAGLVTLLLEVAEDLDAEADSIEAGLDRDRHASVRMPIGGVTAIVRSAAISTCFQSAVLSDLSLCGARLAGVPAFRLHIPVVLELPSCGVKVAAHVSRVDPDTITLAFDDTPHTVRTLERAVRYLAAEADDQEAARKHLACPT
jgi:hypothetical protein